MPASNQIRPEVRVGGPPVVKLRNDGGDALQAPLPRVQDGTRGIQVEGSPLETCMPDDSGNSQRDILSIPPIKGERRHNAEQGMLCVDSSTKIGSGGSDAMFMEASAP